MPKEAHGPSQLKFSREAVTYFPFLSNIVCEETGLKLQVLPQSSDTPAFREDPECGKILKTVLNRKSDIVLPSPNPLTPPPTDFRSIVLLYVTQRALLAGRSPESEGEDGSCGGPGRDGDAEM